MPVILKIEHKDGQRTALWEITENEAALFEMACLNESDIHAFALLVNQARRLEWLAARVLLKEFYPFGVSITHRENGKPLLVNHTDKISISHSGAMVAIALHPKQNPGIDIEMLHPRISKIADRFLGESEKIHVGIQPSAELLTIMWGAKEVMYKVYEYGSVSFKNHFKVNPFAVSSQGILEGVIHKDGADVFIPMEYRKVGEFILVQTDYSSKNDEKNTDF